MTKVSVGELQAFELLGVQFVLADLVAGQSTIVDVNNLPFSERTIDMIFVQDALT